VSRRMATTPEETSAPALASGTFAIGGGLTVNRLGFGAMRLPGVRDPSRSSRSAREMLREAVRLGVDLIDTAHAYGRSEEFIAEALHPCPGTITFPEPVAARPPPAS
jgi:pyridoxine 4-dehydrogenase